MPCILNIETSTSLCSVALAMDGEVIFSKESHDGPSHASLLGVYVEEALGAAKAGNHSIDAVAVSCGPGSYTGLRIGVSMAKGLCFGYGIPLIGIRTLDLLASEAIRHEGGATDRLYCAMMDARRMEVYAAIYDANLSALRPAAADVVDGQTYAEFLAKGPVCFFGNGAGKCASVIDSPNASFIEGKRPMRRRDLRMSPISSLST
jgi:tRNA threonylcarbamoyladenosine biosynthesis protein TsaB